MSERTQIVFMQARLLRLAAEKWHISIQEANSIFDRYDLLKFIEDCFDVFHMEGDAAVFEEIQAVIRSRGGDICAAAG